MSRKSSRREAFPALGPTVLVARRVARPPRLMRRRSRRCPRSWNRSCGRSVSTSCGTVRAAERVELRVGREPRRRPARSAAGGFVVGFVWRRRRGFVVAAGGAKRPATREGRARGFTYCRVRNLLGLRDKGEVRGAGPALAVRRRLMMVLSAAGRGRRPAHGEMDATLGRLRGPGSKVPSPPLGQGHLESLVDIGWSSATVPAGARYQLDTGHRFIGLAAAPESAPREESATAPAPPTRGDSNAAMARPDRGVAEALDLPLDRDDTGGGAAAELRRPPGGRSRRRSWLGK